MAATQELHATDEQANELPRRFDRYELLRKLATGGMAEIYLARQSGLEGFEKVVVVKRILSHLASDEEFVSMFLDEARIAAKLSHPNIVQIYDLGKAEDSYYIAMEYVSGRDVQHLIARLQERGERLPVEHVCRVIAGVCDGLYYAHSRNDYDGTPLNIVHRDISPQNILVSFAGGVKLVDFGIAKASSQLAQTRAGVLKGKYAYMSPEQVRGAKVDHRSDLFAVGLVMYEMLTGNRAFERDSSLKTLKAIVQEKPLNPREVNPEVPMEVVKLLSKALEKNPDRRYKTAQEMQIAIEDYLESSPKKSNNVRLSRYMYDLFEEELSSVEGTMVVKGIGEVIIPASKGLKVVPRIQEEVDHNTLSVALLPGHADEKPAAASLVRNGSSERDPKPRPSVAPPPTVPAESLPHDGQIESKTIPAYDSDDNELEHQQRKSAGQGGHLEHEDKTLAAPPGVERVLPVEGGDARVAALLAKVDAMAAAEAIGTAPGVPAGEDARGPPGRPANPITAPAIEGIDSQDSMIVGSEGRIDLTGGISPPARKAPIAVTDVQATDTPRAGTLLPFTGGKVAALPAYKTPPVFYVALAATLVLSALSVAGVLVIFWAWSNSGVAEYGVVLVKTEPAGATVFIDGEDVGTSPVQAGVARNRDFSIEVMLPGYQTPAPNIFSLQKKELLELSPIILRKQGEAAPVP